VSVAGWRRLGCRFATAPRRPPNATGATADGLSGSMSAGSIIDYIEENEEELGELVDAQC